MLIIVHLLCPVAQQARVQLKPLFEFFTFPAPTNNNVLQAPAGRSWKLFKGLDLIATGNSQLINPTA